MAYLIEEVRDDRTILPLLQHDRRWTAYALCDLDPPYRDNARILSASRYGAVEGLVLLYTLPRVTALLPFGDAAAVQAIVAGAFDLPPAVFVIAREDHLPAVEGRYRPDETWPVDRMSVSPAGFRSPTYSGLPIVRLDWDSRDRLEELYRQWPETFFDPLMLRHGVYFGAEDGDRLVAVAGTHVLSTRHRVAGIGGVFTDPEFRGRGLAAATTGAVTRALFDAGIDPVVLNVKADNIAAQTAYRRLGFRRWLTYREGPAVRR